MMRKVLLAVALLVVFGLELVQGQGPSPASGRCVCPTASRAPLVQPMAYTGAYGGGQQIVVGRQFVHDPYNVGFYPNTFMYGTYGTYRHPSGGPYSYPTGNWFYR